MLFGTERHNGLAGNGIGRVVQCCADVLRPQPGIRIQKIDCRRTLRELTKLQFHGHTSSPNHGLTLQDFWIDLDALGHS